MMTSKGNVLVIDDESAIRRALCGTLGALGFVADEACSGEQGIGLARKKRYDDILLDINMPGIGGLRACKEIRRESPGSGIVMLTVCDNVEQKVEALDSGADDYLTKPFAVPELLARMRAVRRGRIAPGPHSDQISIGEISLDSSAYTVTKSGRRLHLTPREFELLEYMMRHAAITVRHEALLRAVWGPEYGGELEYLRTFMHQLRKKIEDNPASPRYLITEAFVGYSFRVAENSLI